MNSITCDVCGKTDNLEGLINWFHIEVPGIIVRTFQEGPWTPKDFCSIECLKAWADGIH